METVRYRCWVCSMTCVDAASEVDVRGARRVNDGTLIGPGLRCHRHRAHRRQAVKQEARRDQARV